MGYDTKFSLTLTYRPAGHLHTSMADVRGGA